MTLARAWAIALAGLEGRLVEVECDIAAGLPGLSFTGLPDTAVTESRERIRAAVVNSGADWPNRKMTVALLPADLRKVGSRFDLAVVVAVLAASGQLPADSTADTMWIAELGLDGRLRPVPGVLAAVLAARRLGVCRVVVPDANAGEAALVDDMDVRCAAHLGQVLAALTGAGPPLPPATRRPAAERAAPPAAPDLADVLGQPAGRRAVEIAAAGGHHLSLVGPPGSGKTMLAERLPGLLPALDESAALEVTAVHSLAGRFDERHGLIERAPFQAPHHSATAAALVGGGAHLARPGAISLAHRGVLFLDEAPEFDVRALDALRQPLETGEIALHRSGGVVHYPARFQLVLAANPCSCGRRGADCDCTPMARRRYAQRLSGPLLDRLDLRVEVEAVAYSALLSAAAAECAESTAAVAARVARARAAAAARWRGSGWLSNAAAAGPALRSAPWRLPRAVVVPAERFLERGLLSARGFDRILRVSWTIADLAGRSAPVVTDVEEALFYRVGQVASWAA